MNAFEARFGGPPEAVAHAPGRVNLLGEHTDYNEGYVLPAAIPQQTTVSLRETSATFTTVYSTSLDESARFAPGEPPAARFARYVYGCVEELRLHTPHIPMLEISVESRVPIGVGLSSSAALEVATLRALRGALGVAIDDVTLAKIAQRAEIRHAGVNCGILDQMASSLLEPGSMLFLDTRGLEYRMLPLPAGAEILAIDSGVQRALADSKYNERRAECEAAAQRLGVASLRQVDDPGQIERLPDPLRKRARHVFRENGRVRRAVGLPAAASGSGSDWAVSPVPAEDFGRLMNESHASLRDDYEVSIPALDRLVALLQMEANVYGAKLTGAGFGGACVALCRAGTSAAIAERVLSAYAEAGYNGRVVVPPEG